MQKELSPFDDDRLIEVVDLKTGQRKMIYRDDEAECVPPPPPQLPCPANWERASQTLELSCVLHRRTVIVRWHALVRKLPIVPCGRGIEGPKSAFHCTSSKRSSCVSCSLTTVPMAQLHAHISVGWRHFRKIV